MYNLGDYNFKKFFINIFARSPSNFLFNKTTPPNALFLSLLEGSLKDFLIVFEDATPQALLCFIMTVVGSLNSFKKSNPLSISKILL